MAPDLGGAVEGSVQVRDLGAGHPRRDPGGGDL